MVTLAGAPPLGKIFCSGPNTFGSAYASESMVPPTISKVIASRMAAIITRRLPPGGFPPATLPRGLPPPPDPRLIVGGGPPADDWRARAAAPAAALAPATAAPLPLLRRRSGFVSGSVETSSAGGNFAELRLRVGPNSIGEGSVPGR